MDRLSKARTDALQDVVEHVFSGPDLARPADRTAARRGRGPGRAAPDAVPLSRLFGLFIALAPHRLVSEVIDAASGVPCKGPFRLISGSSWSEAGLDDCAQPDLVFFAADAVFIVNLEQARGRAALQRVADDAMLIQRIRSRLRPTRCCVIQLGRAGELPDDLADMRRAAVRQLPHVNAKAYDTLSHDRQTMLIDTIAAFEWSAMSFEDFDRVLAGGASALSGVEEKLVAGLRLELRLRGLAHAPYLASDVALLGGDPRALSRAA